MPKKPSHKRFPKTRKAAADLVRIAKPLIKQAMMHQAGRLGAKTARKIGQNPAKGREVAQRLASRISRIIGSGDYTIGGSPTVNSIMKGGIPVTARFGERLTRFRHREFIGDLQTGPILGTFAIQQYVCNPASSATFPYLATLANLFEQYRFHGLVFEFVSTCSPYAANNAMGSVILSSQLNVGAPIPVSKTQLENCEDAISARMDQNMLYGIECATQANNWYYVRHTGTNPSGNAQLANLLDLCDFNVATAGGTIPAGTVVGELWVTYDIEFTGPRLPDNRYAYMYYYGTSPTYTTPFGTSGALKATGALFGSSVSSTVMTLTGLIPGDMILYTVNWVGTTASTVSMTYTNIVTGLIPANILSDKNSGATSYNISGGADTTVTVTFYYSVTAANPTIQPVINAAANIPSGAMVVNAVVQTIGYGLAASYLGAGL